MAAKSVRFPMRVEEFEGDNSFRTTRKGTNDNFKIEPTTLPATLEQAQKTFRLGEEVRRAEIAELKRDEAEMNSKKGKFKSFIKKITTTTKLGRR